MKTPRRFLISALVFASGVAFADVNPFAEIQNKPNTACSVIEYGLGFIEIALALSPFVIGAVVAFEAYKHTKQQQDGNPTTAGVKTFLVWFISVGIALLAEYYFISISLRPKALFDPALCILHL